MLNALLGGHIKIAFEEPLTAMPHIEAGKMVPIAITWPVRWPTLPDVPRVSEFGGTVVDYDVTGSFGAVVAASGQGTSLKLQMKHLADRTGVFPYSGGATKSLFRSIARTMGKQAIGIMLTGMGGDGADAMVEMSQGGAYTIAQDEASCVVFGMPWQAIVAGGVREVTALSDIASRMEALAFG